MNKKRALVIFIVIVLTVFPAISFAADADVPEDVLQHAQTEGTAFAKDCIIKNRAAGVELAEVGDVGSLFLGRGMKLYDVDPGGAKTLGEALIDVGTWVFTLDNENGPAVLFRVRKRDDGSFGDSGITLADSLEKGYEIMERLAEGTDAAGETILTEPLDNFVLCRSFNGDERALPIPLDGFDSEYLEITDYTQLPRFEEVIDRMLEVMEAAGDPDDPAMGAFTVSLPVHPKGYMQTERTDASAAKAGRSPILVLLPCILAAAAAAAVLIVKIKRSEG